MTKSEALNWLHHKADSTGECDRCHRDGPLWALPEEIDQEPEGHWLYCADCYRTIVKRRMPR